MVATIKKMAKPLAKAATYRMLTTAEVFAISFATTGTLEAAGSIAGITCVTSTLIYLAHDYAFHRVAGH